MDTAWNFGPADDDTQPVAWIVEGMMQGWGKPAGWAPMAGDHPHEAALLKLDTAKARAELGWRPAMRLDEALDWIVDWHQATGQGTDAREISLQQIRDYAARMATPLTGARA
jgi:CDP-glucose 4,6-dehydratase